MLSSKRHAYDLALSVLIPLPLSIVGYDPLGRLETFVAFFTGPIYFAFASLTFIVNLINRPANSEPSPAQLTAILVLSVIVRIGIGLWMLHLLRNHSQAMSHVVTITMSLFFLCVGIMYIVGSQQ